MFTYQVHDKTTLRLLEPRHAEPLFALTDANRAHLREWLPWLDSTTSVKDTLAFIQASQQQFASNNGFQAGIWYQDQIVGVIGFRIAWQNQSTSIGYWLSREFQGRGIMTKACRALADYAFKELGLNRVEIRCAVENLKSRAIPERLGFKNEGTVRQAERLYERFLDIVIYGVLANEWSMGERGA